MINVRLLKATAIWVLFAQACANTGGLRTSGQKVGDPLVAGDLWEWLKSFHLFSR